MDIGSIAIGMVAGVVLGGLIFTSTGREVTKAGAHRVKYHLEPKNKRR